MSVAAVTKERANHPLAADDALGLMGKTADRPGILHTVEVPVLRRHRAALAIRIRGIHPLGRRRRLHLVKGGVVRAPRGIHRSHAAEKLPHIFPPRKL